MSVYSPFLYQDLMWLRVSENSKKHERKNSLEVNQPRAEEVATLIIRDPGPFELFAPPSSGVALVV